MRKRRDRLVRAVVDMGEVAGVRLEGCSASWGPGEAGAGASRGWERQ